MTLPSVVHETNIVLPTESWLAGKVVPEKRLIMGDDVLLPLYRATKSQHASVLKVVNVSSTRMPAGAETSQLQFMLLAYAPMASVMVEPLAETVVRPLHGGGAVVVGGSVAELGTKITLAEKPSAVTLASDVQVTSITLPDESSGAGMELPEKWPSCDADVLLPSYRVTKSQHDSVEKVSKVSITRIP